MLSHFFTKISSHPWLHKNKSLLQFIKFCTVGLTNVTIDFSIYFLLTKNFEFWRVHYLTANLVAFLAANVNSYFLNKRWTFQNTEKNHYRQYTRFLLISCIGLVLNQTILYTIVELFKGSDIPGKVCAVVMVTFWNFSANKVWTFRSTEGIEQPIEKKEDS